MQRRGLVLMAAIFMCATGALAQTEYERIEPSPKQLAKLQALTPEEVSRVIAIKDDDLETIASLTTLRAYQSNGKFTDKVRSDNMFRAFVNKRSGSVRYQLYQSVTYNFEYRNFHSVTYASDTGPHSVKLDALSHDVLACSGAMCTYQDIIGFDLDEQQMKRIAATYVPGASPMWRFKFRAQNGMDWEDRIAPAEAAGLLAAVAAYRKTHGLPDE